MEKQENRMTTVKNKGQCKWSCEVICAIPFFYDSIIIPNNLFTAMSARGGLRKTLQMKDLVIQKWN